MARYNIKRFWVSSGRKRSSEYFYYISAEGKTLYYDFGKKTFKTEEAAKMFVDSLIENPVLPENYRWV